MLAKQEQEHPRGTGVREWPRLRLGDERLVVKWSLEAILV